MLIGSLLALKAIPALKPRVVRELAGVAGLGLIAWAVFVFTKDSAFPGYGALVPCMGACLIIYGGENGPTSVNTLLSFRPLVFVGVISYSLYLWHWPMVVFSKYCSAGDLSPGVTAWVIVASLAIAFVSFEFIESPFRNEKSAITRRQIFSFGLLASVLSGATGLTIDSSHGFPERYDEWTRHLVTKNADRKSDYQEVCSNWRTAEVMFCNIGSASAKKIMFWGDSHVQQLYPLIKRIHDDGGLGGRGVVFAVSTGCPPVEHMNREDGGFHCDSFTHFAMRRAEEEDVDTVFIGFAVRWSIHEELCPSVDGKCVGTISLEETRRRFLGELSEHIRELKTRGKRVIVSLPFPVFDKSIPDLEIRNALFGRFGLSGVATELSFGSLREQVASVAKEAGAGVFDPRKSLCPDQRCITQVDGVSIYKDYSHIAASQVGILAGDMAQVLR